MEIRNWKLRLRIPNFQFQITNYQLPITLFLPVMHSINKKAFSLIEATVSIAIFLLFAIGIYSGIQLVFQIVYNSRLRIIENSILNEQVEIIRNMSFHDLGIVNGSPSGLLDRTATTTRNGIEFLITRTIRNIDDPFDGTIDGPGTGGGDGKVELCHGGNTISVGEPAVQAHLNHGDTLGPCDGEPPPFDSSPADYKFVQLDVICTHCKQQEPLSIATYVAPKFLEGDPTHGALFIEVFDADAEPVQGASVHIVSTETDPTYDFYEITDNDGMLRVVDLAQGVGTYNITVTKDGFTTDRTIEPDALIPNPIKPPSSVIAQGVTEISFSIDEISSINVSTIDALCTAVGNVPFTLRGTEVVGTNPDTFLLNDSVQTDGSGSYLFSSVRWDTYALIVSGYDLVGSIPDTPLIINPATSQEIKLVVGPNTANSLLVMVRDSSSAQPVANANVHVTAQGFDQTKLTGVGSVRQTDWSGGSGQELMSNPTKYWTDDGGVDISTSQGDVSLLDIGGFYSASGNLVSSVFDLGVGAEYVQLEWEPIFQPLETGTDSLKFQVATSSTTEPAAWEYLGPDGTGVTFYTVAEPLIYEVHDEDRYFRYKVYLSTDDSDYTPRLSDLSLTYTNSCTPPGQSYFGGIGSDTYTVEVTAGGYDLYTTDIEVSGDTLLMVELGESI